MEVRGKKLLFLDGSSLAACAVKRAKEMGVYTIVANYYSDDKAPAKKISDEHWEVDFTDIDNMVDLIKKNHVDGIFIGWTDSHLPYYAQICEKAGLACCGTQEQFGILSNDKSAFKALCRNSGVPALKDYALDSTFRKEDLVRIEYPVMVKPANGSGSRGVKKCSNERELIDHYTELLKTGYDKIICEEYISTQKEIFLNYTIQDGYCSLSASYMCFDSELENGQKGPAILHVYPSSYTKLYQDTVESKVKDMFKNLGLKNGILSLQGFVRDDNTFVFHETGLRMGGGQSYVFTKILNNVSALDLIIEYSLTGKMSSVHLKDVDDPYFKKPCVNFYISLKPGVIKSIEGMDKILKDPQILQISTFHKVGDMIAPGKSLDSVIYRMHIIADDKEKMAEKLSTICETLQILSEDGEEMQNEKISFQRVLEMLSV